MEEIKEIIMSHCQGVARPEFELEDLNVMVKEINEHYTKVQSQELTKAKGEIERLKKYITHDELTCELITAGLLKHMDNRVCTCGLDELRKEVK